MKRINQEAAERYLESKTMVQSFLQGRTCNSMIEFSKLCENLRGKGLITTGITGRFELTVKNFGYEVLYNNFTGKLEVSEEGVLI